MVVPTQNGVYFGGHKRSMRVPYAKLVSVVPCSDGIGLQKDGLSAKPLTLTPLDGWFALKPREDSGGKCRAVQGELRVHCEGPRAPPLEGRDLATCSMQSRC